MSDDPASTPAAERLTLQRLEQLVETAENFDFDNGYPNVDESYVARVTHSLAIALNSFDDEATKGLPLDVRDGLRRLRTLLDLWVKRKGWQRVTDPDGETYIKECCNLYEREVCRPFYEAALSYVEGRLARGEDILNKQRDYAREAERLGYLPTVPYIEDVSIVQDLYERFLSAPVIGEARRGLTEEERVQLGHAISLIADGVKEHRRRLDGTDQQNSATDNQRAEPASAKDQENASPVGDQVNAAETNARARDEQSEGDVTTAKVRDSQVNDKPKLNRTQRDLIQAAYQLKAFNEGSARSQSQIVKRYDPSKDPNAGNINRAFKDLMDAGLFASKEGPDGGRWLTEKGRRIAEESTEQNRQA
jgi:hypothetical protein